MTSRSVLRTLVLMGGSVLLLAVPYAGVHFAAYDFDPDFLAIDSCLDAGGARDCSARQCVGRR